MARVYQVQSGAVVVVPVEVTTPADPTSGAVSFSFTAASATDAGTFTAGSWSGSWSSTTQRVTALTPTLPAAAATVELAEGRWKVWVKWIAGTETVVDDVGVLTVA